MEEDVSWCRACEQNGEKKQIVQFQINFEEAIQLCENTQCSNPLGPEVVLLKRKAAEIPIVRKRKSRKSSSSANSTSTTPPPNATDQTADKIKAEAEKSRHIIVPVPVSSAAQPKNEDRNTCAFSSQYKVTLGCQKIASAFQPYKPSNHKPSNLVGQQDEARARVETWLSKTDTVLCNENDKTYSSIDNNAVDIGNGAESDCKPKQNADPFLVGKTQVCYPQWTNKDALCWLDVAMCLLAHCVKVNLLCDGIVKKQLESYMRALVLQNPVLRDSNSRNALLDTVQVPVKVGGGDIPKVLSGRVGSAEVPVTVAKKRDGEGVYDNTNSILESVREEVFGFLEPRLKCVKGRHDSPLFALATLLQESESMRSKFSVNYRWEMKCDICGHEQVDRYCEVIPTLPTLEQDLGKAEPYFIRGCFKCQALGQKRIMKFDSLPSTAMFHFTNGLPHTRFPAFDFTFKDVKYYVAGLIQHRTEPQHFVAWIRDPHGELWMECDDLKSSVSRYSAAVPRVPPEEVHIVLWNRVENQSSKTTSVEDELPNLVGESCAMESDRALDKTVTGNSDKVPAPEQLNSVQVIDPAPQTNVPAISNVVQNCANLVGTSSTTLGIQMSAQHPYQHLDTSTAIPLLKPIPAAHIAVPLQEPKANLASHSLQSGVPLSYAPINFPSPQSFVLPASSDLGTNCRTSRVQQRLAMLNSLKSKNKTKVSHLCAQTPPWCFTPGQSSGKLSVLSQSSAVNTKDEQTLKLLDALKKRPSFQGYVSRKSKSVASSCSVTPVPKHRSPEKAKTVKFLLDNEAQTLPKSRENTQKLGSTIVSRVTEPAKETVDKCERVTKENVQTDENAQSDTDCVLNELYKAVNISRAEQVSSDMDVQLDSDNFISDLLNPSFSLGEKTDDVLDANLPDNMNVDFADFDIDNLLFS